MCTPLPEEEIGKGARWRTDVDVSTGFRLAQSTTLTVTKLEANRMQLDAVMIQSARPHAGHGAAGHGRTRSRRFQGDPRAVLGKRKGNHRHRARSDRADVERRSRQR